MKQKVVYRKFMEIAEKIIELKDSIKSELGESVEIDLEIPEGVKKLFTAISILRDGTQFSAQMNKIKFETLKDAGDN